MILGVLPGRLVPVYVLLCTMIQGVIPGISTKLCTIMYFDTRFIIIMILEVLTGCLVPVSVLWN